MRFLDRIRLIFGQKTEKELDEIEVGFRKKYGLPRFLFATVDGLPIFGRFDNYEVLSAELPELLKFLARIESSEHYFIKTEQGLYLLLQVSEEIIMFAEANKILGKDDMENLLEDIKKELNL